MCKYKYNIYLLQSNIQNTRSHSKRKLQETVAVIFKHNYTYFTDYICSEWADG